MINPKTTLGWLGASLGVPTWMLGLIVPIREAGSLLLQLLPRLILGAFLQDPALVELGVMPLRLIGAGIFIDGLGLILMHALFGVGAARLVMSVSVGLQWLLFLPLAWLLGPVWGLGLTAIWLAMTAYRGLQSLVLAAAWERRRWIHSRA